MELHASFFKMVHDSCPRTPFQAAALVVVASSVVVSGVVVAHHEFLAGGLSEFQLPVLCNYFNSHSLVLFLCLLIILLLVSVSPDSASRRCC